MDYQKVQDYLKSVMRDRDPILAEMEERARRTNFPIIGPVGGSLLNILATSIGAKRIFELGSGYGYSAIWFARALPYDGEIFLTDYSEELLEEAKGYFEKAGLIKRARFLVGDAVENFFKVDGPFDIVYVDIEKEKYPTIVEKAYEKLRKGGFLIADNLLWHGKVMEEDIDSATKGILEFTRLIYSHPGFISSIIPIRDGISISLKI